LGERVRREVGGRDYLRNWPNPETGPESHLWARAITGKRQLIKDVFYRNNPSSHISFAAEFEILDFCRDQQRFHFLYIQNPLFFAGLIVKRV